MPMPKNLSAYDDVRQLADTCLAKRTAATLSFSTSAQATRFRQRFYYFRKLMIDAQVRLGELNPSTPYDGLLVKKLPGDCSLRFEFQSGPSCEIAFDDPATKLLPLSPLPESTSASDPLLTAALNLALDFDK